MKQARTLTDKQLKHVLAHCSTRKHAARAVLLKLTEEITITSLAYDFCFSSPSEFAQYYRTPTPWAALL